MISKKKKNGQKIFFKLFSWTIILSVLILNITFSLAKAPEGKRDGTGGGAIIKLSMTRIRAKENKIELEFSKNVTNILVKDNNLNLFELRDSEGKNIEFEVEIPDDQLEREKRREIYLNLNEPLDFKKKYKLVVKSGFMSKNGEKTEEDIEKNFELGTDEYIEPEFKSDILLEDEITEEIPSKRYIQSRTVIIVAVIFVVSFIVMIIANSRK